MRRASLWWLAGMLAFSGASVLLGAQASRPTSAAPAAEPAEYRQLLDKYCVSCHNQKLKTAGLLLDQADITKIAGDAAVWEKVHRKLREGSMPVRQASWKVGAMIKAVRNSARLISTVLGGVCCMPIAVRRKDSTTTIRVNDVIITRIDGASASTVSRATS